VVAKLDRLSHSMLDFAGLTATPQKQNWALVALDCAMATSTPAAEAMAHVLATCTKERSRSRAIGGAPDHAAPGSRSVAACDRREFEPGQRADCAARRRAVRRDGTERPAPHVVAACSMHDRAGPPPRRLEIAWGLFRRT
jgi:hypothetical protein